MSDSTNFIMATLNQDDSYSDDGVVTVTGQSSGILEVQNEIRYDFVSTNFVGTVTIQGRLKDADISDWRDIGTVTDSYLSFDLLPGAWDFRFGIKQGEYTSGSITCRLDGERA